MNEKKEEKRKDKIVSKINLFTQLIEELSDELVSIYTEGKEEFYHEILIKMIESLDAVQRTVRKAYNIALGRGFSLN